MSERYYGAVYFSDWSKCHISAGLDRKEIEKNITSVELFEDVPGGRRERNPNEVIRAIADKLAGKVGNRLPLTIGITPFGPVSGTDITHTPNLYWDSRHTNAWQFVDRYLRRYYDQVSVVVRTDPNGVASGEWCFGDHGPVLLDLNDLKDVHGLIRRLKATQGPLSSLSQHLMERFSPDLRQQLRQHDILPRSLQEKLVKDLNWRLQGESLYTKERFEQVNLMQTTWRLIQQNPQGRKDRMRLNRSLLEEAYHQEISSFRPNPLVYLQVGKGLGGAVVANGGLVGGPFCPEIGHMRVPVHEQDRDFQSVCTYHGLDPKTGNPDLRGRYRPCIEGLASEFALCRRKGWLGMPGQSDLPTLPDAPPLSCPFEDVDEKDPWKREAWYLARWVANIIFAYAPERICMGGSLMVGDSGQWLFQVLPDLVWKQINWDLPGNLKTRLESREYITPPTLGEQKAGVLGAFALARGDIR